MHVNKGHIGHEASNAIELDQNSSPDSEHGGVNSNYMLVDFCFHFLQVIQYLTVKAKI